MDKRIEKTQARRWIDALKFAALAGGMLVAIYAFSSSRSSSHSLGVSSSGLTFSEAIKGEFEETLSVRGTVGPKTTIYLDAVVGGRVEEKLVEQGEYVEQGQPLVRLLNAALYLDVISREAQISEQLNFLRNTQMQAETNRLDLRRSVLETENEIAHLERKIEQSKRMVERGMVAKSHLQELEQDLKYNRQRLSLSLDRQKQESQVRTLQLEQLEESATKLKENLEFGRSNLESLLVKAPRAGYLSELSVELGELKDPGARLGQIDLPGAFKATASLDEYYLNKVSVGGPVKVRLNGNEVDVEISKIDSRVKNAEFIVEVDLPERFSKIGEGVKRGQSLQLEFIIGATVSESTIIKSGAFSRDTGGNWIFVVSDDGSTAVRRTIKLGRKNENYTQVLEGLDVGERVIVSSYGAFDKAEVLNID